MAIGLSTAGNYGRMETEEMAARMAGLPVDCCEVFLQTFSEYTPAFARRVKAALGGIPVHSVHPLGTQFELNLFALSAHQRQDAWDTYRRVLDAGQILGAGVYVFHGPFVVAHGRGRMPLSRLLPVVSDMIGEAAQRGLRLGFENVSWAWLRSPEDAEILRHELPDLYYVLDNKQAAHAGVDPKAFLPVTAGRLAGLHVCDVDAAGNLRFLGQGVADFPGLIGAARHAGYAGPVIFEPYPSLFDSLEQLRQGLLMLKDADKNASQIAADPI